MMIILAFIFGVVAGALGLMVTVVLLHDKDTK